MTAATFVNADHAQTLWVIRDRVTIQGPVEGTDVIMAEVEVMPMGGTPLHSHPSPETMRMVSGEIIFVTTVDGKPQEFVARAGDALRVPAGAPHGYQNRSNLPATFIALFDDSLCRFFHAVGQTSVPAGPPSAEEIGHVMETARAHGMTIHH